MRRMLWLRVALCPLSITGAWAATDVPGVIEHYCAECHNTTDWAGGLDLTSLDPAHVGEDAESWEKVVRKLRAGMMAPPGKERPSRSQAEAMASILETRLDEQPASLVGGRPADGKPTPAAV